MLRNDEKEIPQLKKLKPKVSIEKILQTVSDELGCSKDARKTKIGLAIYLARDLSGTTCSKLGDLFGGISGVAITAGYNKIAGEIAENKRLKRKVAKIRARIVNI
ncbi:MAG: hypothetical protein HF982_06875 [Desulfobacteraceae bacterium]|nr:hypothetical protein [Desulfobacteraceae bacterium]MBC2719294.1 hypothetical protein [Desulfobacteraceae bacterium]